MEALKNVKEEFIRTLLTDNLSFSDIMQKVMKIGSEITKEVGHKDYESPEAFFLAIKEGTSPLTEIDGEIETDFEGKGTNLICVKTCPIKEMMSSMSNSGTSDNRVDTVMDHHQLREGEESNYSDVGCYVMQQIRQMVISSITIKGEYVLNYIHLGCDKGTGNRTISTGDVESVGLEMNTLNKILDQCDCAYTISFKE